MHECLMAALLSLAVSHGADRPCDVSGARATAERLAPSGSGMAPAGEEPDEAGDPGDGREAGRSREPGALADQAVVYGATIAYAAAYGHVRKQMFEKGSLSKVLSNFRRPIRSAVEGARNDRDPFETNYIAHPVSWGLVGYYLRSRGHPFWSSLAMSQGHSVFWEYVIEGSYAKPSGKDLITNLVGAAAGIALAGWLENAPSAISVEVTPGPPGFAGRGPVRAERAGRLHHDELVRPWGTPSPGATVRLRLFH